MAEYFEKARKLEGRVASDQDLKTSDLLRYYVRDTEAAKNLLYRRARCLADFENANKALDKARVKGKEIAAVSMIKAIGKFGIAFSKSTANFKPRFAVSGLPFAVRAKLDLA